MAALHTGAFPDPLGNHSSPYSISVTSLFPLFSSGETSGRDMGEVPAVQPAEHHHVRRSQAELPDEPAERPQDPPLQGGEWVLLGVSYIFVT